MNPTELTKFKFAHYDGMMRDGNLSAVDLKIAWLLLFKYMNRKTMTAYPAAETMAEDIGASVRTVRRSIGHLTAAGGYFTVVRGGGRGHSNHYSPSTLTVTGTSPFSEERVTQTVIKGDSGGQERVTDSSPEPLDNNPTDLLRRRSDDEGVVDSPPANIESLKKQLFGPCLNWLGTECPMVTDASLRSLVGKWCRDFGDGATLEALLDAQRNSPVDPRAYIEKILATRKANGADPRTEADDEAALARGLGLDPPGEHADIPPGTVEIDADPMDAPKHRCGTWPTNRVAAVAEVTGMVECRDRHRAVELRQKIRWYEGQETKLDASFATPIAEAKAELEGILSRLSGKGQVQANGHDA